MSQYSEARKKLSDQPDDGGGRGGPRTDYRCRAHGCPNAGCIDDEGEKLRGRCYFHWREPDPSKWPAITERIHADFERMRNHGAPMPPSKFWAGGPFKADTATGGTHLRVPVEALPPGMRPDAHVYAGSDS